MKTQKKELKEKLKNSQRRAAEIESAIEKLQDLKKVFTDEQFRLELKLKEIQDAEFSIKRKEATTKIKTWFSDRNIKLIVAKKLFRNMRSVVTELPANEKYKRIEIHLTEDGTKMKISGCPKGFMGSSAETWPIPRLKSLKVTEANVIKICNILYGEIYEFDS